MVRRFINPSTIQFFKKIKKIPTAAAHGGKEYIPPWDAVLPQRHANVGR
jgi:hypothetical protein